MSIENSECTDVVVFLAGNEKLRSSVGGPAASAAEVGLGEKFPGRECTDIVLVLQEDDSPEARSPLK
jgi:hypothetical protein